MNNMLKNIMIVAGVQEIMVGILHFMMPYFLNQSAGFLQLSSTEMDFVILVTFATGILLVAFGSVTLLLSKVDLSMIKVLYYYLWIKIILWATRVVLVLVYPVNLDMFYINPFTLAVFPGLVSELGLFIIAMFLVRKTIARGLS